MSLKNSGKFNSLGGYIISDTNAWFRVGSAYNHATHVRKEWDTWVMRYYDTDKPVNETLARLWGAVPNTEVEVLDDGVLAKNKKKRERKRQHTIRHQAPS